jgi:hypothetical protein
MRRPLAWTVPLLTACAVLQGSGSEVDTEVFVRSHNASDVDVYLLCGDRDAEWLGVVPRRTGAAFAISPSRRICALGLNFFLVVRSQSRGYWVGPFRPQNADDLTLVIEKYAGLSSVVVRSGGR